MRLDTPGWFDEPEPPRLGGGVAAHAAQRVAHGARRRRRRPRAAGVCRTVRRRGQRRRRPRRRGIPVSGGWLTLGRKVGGLRGMVVEPSLNLPVGGPAEESRRAAAAKPRGGHGGARRRPLRLWGWALSLSLSLSLSLFPPPSPSLSPSLPLPLSSKPAHHHRPVRPPDTPAARRQHTSRRHTAAGREMEDVPAQAPSPST